MVDSDYPPVVPYRRSPRIADVKTYLIPRGSPEEDVRIVILVGTRICELGSNPAQVKLLSSLPLREACRQHPFATLLPSRWVQQRATGDRRDLLSITSLPATPTGRCAPQGGNCGILRQTPWDGSMKRRTLKWHLLLVLSVLVSCDCTRI
jgi:hypothetical protein